MGASSAIFLKMKSGEWMLSTMVLSMSTNFMPSTYAKLRGREIPH